MKIIKYIYKSSYSVWFLLVPLFLVTRLLNLKIIPIFTDEAIYSYWAQVALHDPANRFMSLEDGKQPLFIWFAAVAQLFINDPLVATRLVSVSAGFLAVIGIYCLGKELFDKRVATITAFLYIIVPFSLLYDRMGLFDSFLTMLGIWAIYLSVKMAKTPRLDLALLSGYAIGFAEITKSSGNFFLYFLPFSLINFNFGKNNTKRILKWLFFACIALIESLVIYNSLRLSQYFYIIARKNSEFIRPAAEVIKDPFLFFNSNFFAILSWVTTYLGFPLMVIFLAGLAIGFYKRDRRIIYLSLLILIPFMVENLFNKVLYPRFVLFYLPYILIVIAFGVSYALQNLKKLKWVIWLMFAGTLVVPVINSFLLITKPTSANIPTADSSQYLNDWPAGYGVQEVVEFLKNESKNQEVNIGTEGTFGVFPFALNIYFYNNKNVHVYSFWPVDTNKIPGQIQDLSKKQKTYFVFNQNQQIINNPNLKLIKSYQKGIGKSFMRLYEVNP